jgi:isoleucyl-tRNA synthetase
MVDQLERDGDNQDTQKFYITTAIDYLNGEPHIGHSLEKVAADVVARALVTRNEQAHLHSTWPCAFARCRVDRGRNMGSCSI